MFYVSGILAERYPDLMKAIVAAGHDIAAHAWAQNIVPAYQTETEERADLLRCISTIEATSSRRPAGWISPRCTPSIVTTALLAEQGFAWHSDIFDTDVPYKLETPRGSVVGVPFTMEVNDMPLYIRYGNEPKAFSHILARLLSQWPDAAKRPCCLDITVHAHMFGRPYGIIELIESLRLARRYEALARLTTHAELAALCA